ncbi:MAG: flagellar filament capping protein FliD [Sulfuricurvum sp.]|uniref:flagellar filament capping protein FliD n=1 Tax=Sulfuricurvum sp. TaxID=2025608 RepID=UPI0025F355CD|nr:flagellar filament capping protein FliD [Sulfuricurvum sp.]MBV5320246.1 flagellar filament capping protein FliD [Sulfuricurvum sp.]
MAGTVSSLGIGSGVLTADVIDKLKAADSANIITPIDNKITLNNQKNQALDLLNSLLTSFKSSVSALDDDSLYQARTVSGGNDYVSVSAAAGSQIRDFSLSVTNIAKKSVIASGDYPSLTAPIANGPGTLNLGIGGKNYSISYTASTTLTDLKQAINDAAGSSVTASTLQTGTSKYNLVLTSNTTGQDQAISLTDVSGNLSDTKLLTKNTKSGSFLAADDFVAASGTSGTMTLGVGGTTKDFAYTDTTTLQGMADMINADTTMNTKVSANIVQYGSNDFRMVLTPKSGDVASAITMSDSAGGGLSSVLTTGTSISAGSMGIIQDGNDAHFTFDGISMTRSTNSITDISSGLTVNLLKDLGSANISVSQDRSKVATNMQSMVSSYNTLIKQLDDMTAYDATAGKVGIFNGDNTIKNISREITRMITSVNSNGQALPDYGIGLDKTGVMTFDSDAFTTKMNADPDGTEAFFSGKTTISSAGIATTADGIFTSFNNLLYSYTSSATGLVTNLTQATKDATTTLNADKAKANALLTARYDTMTAKFAAYDSMISKLESSFASLKQQIAESTASSG